MRKVIVLLLCCYMNITIPQQIISLFVHGIADSGKQALPFAKASGGPYVVEGPLATFDFDCSTKRFWRVHMPACSLGQESELEKLAHEWQKLNKQFPHADGFILIGVSRGASAILNFLATYKPDKVKAVILDSPFDKIDTVAKHIADRMSVSEALVKKAIPLMFWKFNPQGIFPIDLIHKIEDDIPMLFVTVKGDHMVPKVSTTRLLNARKQQGHSNCHHLHVMRGSHGKIIQGPDARIYQDVAHAFFAHYGLPHNSKHARHGRKQFSRL